MQPSCPEFIALFTSSLSHTKSPMCRNFMSFSRSLSLPLSIPFLFPLPLSSKVFSMSLRVVHLWRDNISVSLKAKYQVRTHCRKQVLVMLQGLLESGNLDQNAPQDTSSGHAARSPWKWKFESERTAGYKFWSSLLVRWSTIWLMWTNLQMCRIQVLVMLQEEEGNRVRWVPQLRGMHWGTTLLDIVAGTFIHTIALTITQLLDPVKKLSICFHSRRLS